MENNSESHYTRAIYTFLRISFVALIVYWSYLIVKPFILITVWSIILSIAIYPLFKWMARKLGGREKLTALILVLVGLTILLVPSVLMIDSTVDSLQDISDKLKTEGLKIPPPKEKVAEWPVFGETVYDSWMMASENLQTVTKKFRPQIRKIGQKTFTFAGHLVTTLLLFLLSIILAGVFLVFARPMKKASYSVFDTLIGEQGADFTRLSVATTKSVVNGILLIAITQSLLGGVGMWLVGIPAAGLWAILVLMIAIVQLPPLLILGPIAIYSFTIVPTTPAIIFTIWCIFVGTSDAILKPLFLGRGVDVPMPAVLVGAIGGVILYGMIGLFVGAVVLAITYKVIDALLVQDVLDQPSDGEEGGSLKEVSPENQGDSNPQGG